MGTGLSMLRVWVKMVRVELYDKRMDGSMRYKNTSADRIYQQN